MRTIKIKSNGLGRYDDVSPFIIESGALELKIELPQKSGEFYLVSELNGKSGGAQPVPREGTLTLTGLETGELKAAVKHYLRGELIEVYKVEPLLLKAVDKELSAMPEIALLTGKIAALKKQTEDLEKRLETAEDRTETAGKNISAILHFAYLSYRENVRLNAHDLSEEGFIKAINEKSEEKL